MMIRNHVMKYLQGIWRRGKITFFALAGWLVIHSAAVAAPAAAQPKINQTINSEVYVFAYFLVILGVVGGVVVACRSGGRRDRARPEQYDAAKIVPKK